MNGIVKAKTSDLPLLSELGQEFYEDYNLPGDFIPEVFVKNWSGIIESGTGQIFIAKDNGRMVGGLGCIGYHCFNDGGVIAFEMFWFISQAYRGSLGLRLFKEFEKWADSVKAKKIICAGLLPNIGKIHKFYTRKGFTAAEVHYIKEI